MNLFGRLSEPFALWAVPNESNGAVDTVLQKVDACMEYNYTMWVKIWTGLKWILEPYIQKEKTTFSNISSVISSCTCWFG